MLRRLLLCGVAALLLLGPAASARAAVTEITYPGIANATGLDVAPDGALWVVDSSFTGEFLVRLDPSGANPTIVDDDLNQPSDVVTDAAGNAYVADRGSHKIKKYAPDGTPLTSWTAGNNPVCVEVDKDGNVLTAAESGTADRIRKWTPQGVLLDEWGAGGFGDPPKIGAVDGGCLAAASDGTTYLSDNQNERVSHFAADGTFLDSFSTVGADALDGVRPMAIALFGDDELLVGSAHHGFVVGRFTRDGDRVAPLYRGTDGRGLDVRSSDGVVFASGYAPVLRIDKRPTAQLAVAPSPAYDTQLVRLDASASFVELGVIERFEWDLDGDGTFELDTGAQPAVEHTFGVGARPVAVRVTGDRGDETSTATATADIRRAPPPGLPGVSIDDGARFTNSPEVTLHLRWPAFAQNLVASNDGGFSSPLTTAVVAQQPWTLDSSGSERLPKSVYVRFTGGASGPETYQDDIILDQTAPAVESATLAPEAAAARARTQAAGRYRIDVAASDATSGVADMQIANDRALPGPWVPYARTTSFSGALPVFVRVRDFAGNPSSWTDVSGATPLRPSAPTALPPAAFPREAVREALRQGLASVRRGHRRLSPRALARRRVLTHRLRWPTAGTVSVRWRATVRGRTVTVARGAATRSAAGRAAVAVRPTAAGRRLLRRARRARMTVTAIFRQGTERVTAGTAFTLRR